MPAQSRVGFTNTQKSTKRSTVSKNRKWSYRGARCLPLPGLFSPPPPPTHTHLPEGPEARREFGPMFLPSPYKPPSQGLPSQGRLQLQGLPSSRSLSPQPSRLSKLNCSRPLPHAFPIPANSQLMPCTHLGGMARRAPLSVTAQGPGEGLRWRWFLTTWEAFSSHKASLSPTSREGRCYMTHQRCFSPWSWAAPSTRPRESLQGCESAPRGRSPMTACSGRGTPPPSLPGDRAPSCKWPPPWGQQGRA